MSIPSYPYGCAVCEVEVDPDTGLVEVVREISAVPSSAPERVWRAIQAATARG